MMIPPAIDLGIIIFCLAVVFERDEGVGEKSTVLIVYLWKWWQFWTAPDKDLLAFNAIKISIIYGDCFGEFFFLKPMNS